MFGACKKNDMVISKQFKNDLVLLNDQVIYLEGNEMDNLLLSQLGIDYVKSLDSLTDNDIYNLISNGIFGYDISSALLIGVVDNKGVLLQSELDDSKFLIVGFELSDNGLYEIANKVNMDIDTDNKGTLAKVKYSSLDLLDEPIIIDIVNFIPLCSCQPNERLLGPRRNDESYRDCIERNWDNFGTDLPSKLAQTFNPGAVLAAISITCLGKTTTVEG